MDGLNREASRPVDRCRPSEGFHDLIDDMGHGLRNIRLADILQPPIYPICDDACIDQLWQNGFVEEPAFDRKKIAAAMKSQKVTQTGMARVMGLPSQSAFSNIMKGKRRVEVEEARKAYEFLGIARPAMVQMVPLIGITSAGRWREAIQMSRHSIPIPPGAASEQAFALEVAGDSMDRLIPDGGHIIVDPRDKELRDKKVYLIQNPDGEATVKQYRRSPPRFVPVSNNDEHQEMIASEIDFIVLGRVVLKVEGL